MFSQVSSGWESGLPDRLHFSSPEFVGTVGDQVWIFGINPGPQGAQIKAAVFSQKNRRFDYCDTDLRYFMEATLAGLPNGKLLMVGQPLEPKPDDPGFQLFDPATTVCRP